MDERERIAADRKLFSRMGFAFLGYYLSFSLISILLAAIPGITIGLGYLVTSALILGLFFTWKKPGFFLGSCRFHRKMTPGRLLILLVAVIGGQSCFQLLFFIADMIARIVDADISGIIGGTATAYSDWGVILYTCLAAPLLEECVFRGWFLRSCQPYGKTFAITVSALFFGLLHGNVVQSPFAFTAGLIFGYVAVEFGLHWALFLHIFNNLVLGKLLPLLLLKLPFGFADGITFLLYWSCAIVTAIYLYLRGETFLRYWKENQPKRKTYSVFVSACGVWIAIGILLVLTFAVLFV